MRNQLKIVIAVSIILLLLGLLLVGLNQNPSNIRSPVMHKAVPNYSGFKVGDESPFNDHDMQGKPYFLNVWATWCSSCTIEHQVWMNVSKAHKVSLVGVLYNDNITTAKSWLNQHGNPYTHLVNDPKGKLIVNLGAYGTPETLFIDAKGIIRKRFIGPINPEWINQTFKEFNL